MVFIFSYSKILNNMKKIKLFLFAAISLLALNSCIDDNEPTNLNYVAFSGSTSAAGVGIGATTTSEITVYTANTSSSERTFDLMLDVDNSTADAGSYTLPASVTVPAGSNKGTFNVEVTDGSWLDTDKSIILNLVPSDSSVSVGNSIKVEVYRLCPGANEVKMKFSIKFDTYPEEVYWRIEDSTGATVLASQANPGFGAYAGMSGTLELGLCIEAGTYTFKIWDQYSDGAGKVSIKTYSGTPLFATDGKYGAGTSATFTVEK